MIERRELSPKELRLFAGLVLPAFSAALAWMVHGRFPAAVVPLVAIGVVLGIAGLVRPAIAAAVYRGLTLALFPIGWVVSHVLLAVVYYLLLTPIGLVLRASGRDPLHRKIQPEAPSYWIERDGPRAPDTYFRQH